MVFSFSFLAGCASFFHQPGQESVRIYSRAYYVDYNTAWQSVIEALKQYDRVVQNRQGGIVQTAWTDNTAEKNFIDSFGGTNTYLKARYRLSVSVAPKKNQSVKVSITKEQGVQKDLLEGWSLVPTDSITENTILYRVGRIIANKQKLHQMEEKRLKEVIGEMGSDTTEETAPSDEASF
ncbi:MAG: hypothetical protein AB7F43_13470 [Bacteriovoracia bacterium]